MSVSPLVKGLSFIIFAALPSLATAQTGVTIKQIDRTLAPKVFAGYTDIAKAHFGASARDSLGDESAQNVVSFPAGTAKEWSAPTSNGPVDLVIALPGPAPAAVGGFELVVFKGGRSEFEVFVSATGENGPWKSLGEVSTFVPQSEAASAYQNEDQIAPQLYQFSQIINIRALRIRFKKAQFYTYYHVRHVAIFAQGGSKDAGLPDVVAGGARNLASPNFEGGLIRYPGSDALAQLLHDGDLTSLWTAPNGSNSANLTFMFGEGEAVRLDRIELVSPPSSSFVRADRATVSVSISDTPTRGMQRIQSLNLNWRAGRAIIDLPKGTLARFVDISLSQPNGSPKPIALSEVQLIESNARDYQSLVVIGRKSPGAVRASSAQTQISQDQEPNDTVAQAQQIPVGQSFAGALWPETDVDILRLDATSAKEAELDIKLEALSGVTASFSIARKIAGSPPNFAYNPPVNAALPTTIKSGDYLVRVGRPQSSSIVVVIDDSGSMSGQSDNIYAAFSAFLAAKRPNDAVAVVRFGASIETLSDFTSDADLLANRLADQLGKSGGSPVYKGLLKAGELLRQRPGDRAIILISDGANSSSSSSILDVWSLLKDDSIRFYGIGFGPDLNPYTDYSMPARARRVLDTWARASGGFFAEAPDGAELAQVFSRISQDFRQPSRYRITTNLREISYGQIEIGSVGVQIAGENAPLIELILDASGSMRSKKNKIDGALKIDVAKKVLTDVINALPIGAEVGVRVFGQNIREGQSGDCFDIEVIKPYGPVNRAQLIAQINAIRPLGTTPIYSSLLLAMGDLRDQGGTGKKVIVILTDGKEECRDPSELPGLAAAAQDFGVDLQLNIVGFALADEKTKSILTEAASVTGGQFFDAQDGKSLARALRRSFGSLDFNVRVKTGKIIAKGRVDGPPLRLRAGVYTVDVLTANGVLPITNVRVKPDLRHTVNLVNKGDALGVTERYQPLGKIDGN
ncbi:MAG: VWA domain-containing protein [Alphaproteobacteria bacterium]|nr:VWA domain-containing protein [Alphaproteobacteria bacterium]